MQGDVSYDFLEQQEEGNVVKQIDVLQKQLDFLHCHNINELTRIQNKSK
jgi:hypothetical protein